MAVEMTPVGVLAAEFTLVVPPNPTADELKQTIMNRRVDFNISKYVNEGWIFTKHNICQFFGIGLILVLVSVGINIAYMYAMGFHFWSWVRDGSEPEVYVDYEESPFYWHSTKRILIFCAFAVGRTLLFGFPIMASLYKAVFNAMRNNTTIQFKDFFSCFTCPYWFHVMGMGVIYLIANGMTLLFLPFAIPAFYFTLTSMFALPLHVEHYSFIGVWNSLYFSFKVFHRYFCSMLGFLLLLCVLQILGALCFIVGLFVTLPVAFVSLCYCYHHVIGVNGVAVLVPSSHLEGLPAEAVTPQVPMASAPSAIIV
jgi:hypothetical protein